jgi:hypothetical protein
LALGLRVDDEQRRQFSQLLRRVYEQDAAEEGSASDEEEEEGAEYDDKDGSCVLSRATLERLASSAAPRLEDLTPDEQRALVRAVRNGSLRCAHLQ